MISTLLTGFGVSALCGLDRTAAFQFMLARPIVAAPLTGVCLGDPMTGLLLGGLIELLWLGRLPMGAAIPPDDTQVAIGATFLAVVGGSLEGVADPSFALLAVLVCLPLGKVGKHFDQWARYRNDQLVVRCEAVLARGELGQVEKLHLRGLLNFILAAWGTFWVIVLCGGVFLHFLAPLLLSFVGASLPWLKLYFPMVGAAFILAHINASRALTLFGSSFLMTFLLLWLL